MFVGFLPLKSATLASLFNILLFIDKKYKSSTSQRVLKIGFRHFKKTPFYMTTKLLKQPIQGT